MNRMVGRGQGFNAVLSADMRGGHWHRNGNGKGTRELRGRGTGVGFLLFLKWLELAHLTVKSAKFLLKGGCQPLKGYCTYYTR